MEHDSRLALTGFSFHSAVRVTGDYRATRLRSTVLDGDRLLVRLGIRWRMTVPRERIEAVRLIGRRVSVEPVDFPFCPVRVRVFELGLDDPEGLQEALGLQA